MRHNTLPKSVLFLPFLLVSCFLLCLGFCFFGSFFVTRTLWISAPGFLLLLGVGGYLALTRRLTHRHMLILLFIGGFLLRLCYILYTSTTQRQHDFGSFGGAYESHAGYISYLADFGKLPEMRPTSVWQFYHPPLHHILAALWLKLQMLLGVSYGNATEGIQFLTLFYATCCLWLSYLIFKELGLTGTSLVCAFSLMAFNPSFVIFAGSLNNDILSITFIYAATLAGLRWGKKQRVRHIVPLALCIGLGMLTKTSGAIVAPCTALVFALVFFQKKANKKELLKQFGLFAAICFPLGLFWAVRNLLLFGEPCLSVPMLSLTNPQYVGDYSLVERFLVPIKETFSSEFILWKPVFENHMLAGLLKTSAFGEFTLSNTSSAIAPFTPFLLLFTVILAFLGLYGGIQMARDKSASLFHKIFTCGNYLLLLLFYFYFCYSFPHTCSMNIRYVALLLGLTAFFVGKIIQKGRPLWLSRLAVALCVPFCLFSLLTYTLLGVPLA